ncbi:hypothetical protein Acsp04_08350 [Actinomadura sp. NBRC 104425]|nr:hypothetical protein Acsp04_08350 [Actinomadura sp. NBRC 104425]
MPVTDTPADRLPFPASATPSSAARPDSGRAGVVVGRMACLSVRDVRADVWTDVRADVRADAAADAELTAREGTRCGQSRA